MTRRAKYEPLSAALEFVSTTDNCARNEETHRWLSPADEVEDHHHEQDDDQHTDDSVSRSSERKHLEPPYRMVEMSSTRTTVVLSSAEPPRPRRYTGGRYPEFGTKPCDIREHLRAHVNATREGNLHPTKLVQTVESV